MKKLLIYGDSILRGITFDEGTGRHKLCRGYKLDSLSRCGYELCNHARMGATIDKGVDFLTMDLDGMDKDTTVILEFGGNDCDYNWDAISAAPTAEVLPHTPQVQFLRLYGDAIRRVQSTGATVLICTLVPIDAQKYLSVITKERSYDNIMAWLGDTSMLYRFQEHYNRIVESLAMTYGCPLIDLRGEFLLSHRYPTLISPDGIHPSEAGHELIETTIRNTLLSLSRSTHASA